MPWPGLVFAWLPQAIPPDTRQGQFYFPCLHKAVLEIPEFAAGRSDQKKKPSAVEELERFVRRLGRPDFGVCERYNPFRHNDSSLLGVVIFPWGSFSLKQPPKPSDFTLSHCTISDNRKRKRPGIPGLSGQYRTILDDDLVELSGIEPLTS